MAIEFALMLPLLFVVFYASVSYGAVFMLSQSLTHAAEEGARAGFRADTPAALEQVIEERVGKSLAWLPASTREAVSVTVGTPDTQGWLNIAVELPSSVLPFAPLKLPGYGTVPRLPENLRAEADMVLPPRLGSSMSQ
ncbi:pilus assembly protein [Guyparkeria hydrothermalis]|uniref:TadE/TadG family type IV pilus assembly protein n=1 Tax=Guyparkeria hydrothermalis TaxID=923 RepID=UPI0020208049|nr:pilus assembly protein [Guyparkeria hydrothermalis]